MRVFISHSSKDKDAVEQLANQLAEYGFEVWYDGWEILSGDDIVAKINHGLDKCEAGIIVFSKHSLESRWVEAETSYLTYARIQESKVLIPIVVDQQAWVPPLVRPLARREITEVEAIRDALRSRRAGPPAAKYPEHGEVERVLIGLYRRDGGTIDVEVKLRGELVSNSSLSSLPGRLVNAHQSFLQG